MADYARAFRMEVLGCDVRDITLPGVTMVPLEHLLAHADVISLHIHLTPANHHFINASRLAAMKPGTILINTSRGAIADEAAVLAALQGGRLAAYGTDVIDGEWRTDLHDHPLIAYARAGGNIAITPHVGGVTRESQSMAFAFNN